MNSFWEYESLLSYDVGIVGAGITGLSTAISIKEKNPDTTIAVFDSGTFTSGASTKNAGFACFGSITELLEDENQLGSLRMIDLVQKRWNGLQLLINRIGESNLEFENNGGFELLFEPILQSEIDRINQLLYPIFHEIVFKIDNSLIEKFGFDSNRVKQVIVNPFEGQINTGKMMNHLLKLAGLYNIRIFTNTPVLEIINTGIKTKETDFKCNQIVVCTNAFTKNLIPEISLVPGRGQVLITKPIENLKFKGVFHYDDGYFYFRNVGNRVLFGGGRNIDFEIEETTELKLNHKIQSKLIEDLKTFILPSTPFEIDQQWSGIMAFGEDKYPIVKRINNQLTIAVKLGGMGIALGSLIGEESAQLTLENFKK